MKMRRAIPCIAVALALTIFGCSDPENEPIRTWARYTVVPWKKGGAKRSVRNAAFLEKDARPSFLLPGTNVQALPEKAKKNVNPDALVKVLVKVMDGPNKDKTGHVYRPHLRMWIEGAPVDQDGNPTKVRKPAPKPKPKPVPAPKPEPQPEPEAGTPEASGRPGGDPG